jgi:Domain of unknown function (DUF5658)
MFRCLTVAVIGFVMTASSVFAEDHAIANAINNAFPSTTSSITNSDETESPNNEVSHFRKPERPWPLPALYGSSAFLQGYDAYLTLAALKRGASEVNPILKPISGDPVAFIAVKAGLTAVSFVGAERLWKDNHRLGAVALMVASNAMMVVVTAHNNAVLQRIK